MFKLPLSRSFTVNIVIDMTRVSGSKTYSLLLHVLDFLMSTSPITVWLANCSDRCWHFVGTPSCGTCDMDDASGSSISSVVLLEDSCALLSWHPSSPGQILRAISCARPPPESSTTAFIPRMLLYDLDEAKDRMLDMWPCNLDTTRNSWKLGSVLSGLKSRWNSARQQSPHNI